MGERRVLVGKATVSDHLEDPDLKE